jgi:hypothetical protein
MEYSRTQEEEMKLAYETKRQPICVYCCHPLDKIVEKQDHDIVWTYDKALKQYKKSEEGVGQKPYHDCGMCADRCSAEDWGYIDEKLVAF